MSDTNIFSGGDTNPPNNAPANSNAGTVDPNAQLADLLKNIKNDQGEPKYRDLPTALEALRHSQEFIPSLKSEKERLEKQLQDQAAEIARLKGIAETIEKLQPNTVAPADTPAQVGVKAEDVASLVSQALSREKEEATKAANLKTTVEAMQSHFGDKAAEVFYGKAAELGMTKEFINGLAMTAPAAVLKMFGVEAGKSAAPNAFNPAATVKNTVGVVTPTDSYIGRNKDIPLVGATFDTLLAERENSKKMVDELHAQGLSVDSLTDPKVFFKKFGGI